jgi:hypothetical protein
MVRTNRTCRTLSDDGMGKKVIQNMLIVLGCYWLSLWVVVIPIMMLDSKFTGGIIYIGTLGALLMHVITAIPISIVAFGAGILCVYSIEGISQKKWLLILSLLYAMHHFTSFHWVHKPDVSGLLFQGMESFIPAIACYLGGTIVFNELFQRV